MGVRYARNRSNRQPLGTLLQQAHENSLRRSHRPRTGRLNRFAAGSATADELEALPGGARVIRWFIAALLLPICFVTSLTLFQTVADPSFFGPFWRSAQFWYFSLGVVVVSGWFFTGVCREALLYLYVLGHELTHALFVWASFGKVAEINVTREGGYIITNKSNVLIALSPYFVPFWTVVLFGLVGLLGKLTDIEVVGRGLFFAVGLTWGFHLLWTLWMIPRDQPDLKENDTLFSLVVIYLANICLLAGLVCVASDRVTWSQFGSTWIENGESFVVKGKLYLEIAIAHAKVQ